MSNGDAHFGEANRLPRVEPPVRLPPTVLIGGGAIEQMFDNVELVDRRSMHLPNLAIPSAHVVLQNSYQNAANVGGSIKRCIAPFLTAAGIALRDFFRRAYGNVRRVGWRLRELARDMGSERVYVTSVNLDGR